MFMTMICKKCGTENADKNKVCEVCGCSLSDESPTPVNEPRRRRSAEELYEAFRAADLAEATLEAERKEKKKKNRFLAALGGIASFMGRHWKWLLPGVIVLVAILVIWSMVASIEPDVGNLALTPEYVRFSLSGETAEGAIPLVGLMDGEGNVVLAAEYQSILGEVDKDRFAVIGGNSKIGVVDENGREVIPCTYLSVDTEIGFSDGLWAVETSAGWGYVDKKGREKIAATYVDADGFSDGLAAVYNGTAWGYINQKGEQVVDFKYEDAAAFHDGLARVCLGGLYGFIDEKGNEVITPQFTSAYSRFEDDLCLIRVGGRYGFIDKKGEYVINPQFDDALPFSEGLAAVRLEEKVGYVDKKGQYIIKPQYDGGLSEESLFHNGRAVVYVEETALLIDKSGKVVVRQNTGCSELYHLHDGFLIACVDGKYGLLDLNTGELTGTTYDELRFALRDTVVFGRADDTVNVFVNKDGEVVAEVGSQLSEIAFYSSISDGTRALADWCENR